jgi:hypothetical protein
MITGLDAFTTFTWIHTIISVVMLVSGFVVVIGLLRGHIVSRWTELFLATGVLTSVTGFGFTFNGFLPSHGVGIVSLVILAVAILALYVYRLAGKWRWIYATCAVTALYLDFFVGIAQSFNKVTTLHALAPTQAEPPFAYAEGAGLLIFLAICILAIVRFRPLMSARF